MNKKKIIFAGAYGIQNAGDDLPLIQLTKKLKQLVPDYEFDFVVISRHPNKWEESEYGVRMIKNPEYESSEEAMNKWFYGFNFGDDQSFIREIEEEISSSDLLVMGAGNFLIDMTIDLFRGPIPLMSFYTFLAEINQIPIMLYGLSVGPIKSEFGKKLSRWIINKSNILTVRDDLSKLVIKNELQIEKDVTVLPDSAISEYDFSEDRIKEILKKENIKFKNKKILALGLRDLRKVYDKKTVNNFEIELFSFINTYDDYDILFIPQSTYPGDDDREYAEELIQKYSIKNCHSIKGRYVPKDIISIYSICEFSICIRLHAAVFSFIANTPMIAISYLPKVNGFLNSIDQPNLGLAVDEVNNNSLERIKNDILNKYNDLKIKFSQKHKSLTELTNNYAKLIIEKKILN